MRRAPLLILAMLPASVAWLGGVFPAQAQQKPFAVEPNRNGFVVVSPPQNNVFTAAPVRSASAGETGRNRRPRAISSGAYFEGTGAPAAEAPQNSPEGQPPGAGLPPGMPPGSNPGMPPGALPEGVQARAPAPPSEGGRSPAGEGIPPVEEREDGDQPSGERSAERPAPDAGDAERPEG